MAGALKGTKLAHGLDVSLGDKPPGAMERAGASSNGAADEDELSQTEPGQG